MARQTFIVEEDTIVLPVGAITAVDIPAETEDLEVTPSTSQQVFHHDEYNTYYDTVTVDAVTADIDANIVAGNILRGVSILGVEGVLDPDKPDQTKTVTPTEQTQEVVADSGYELAKAIVNPIPSNYKNTNNANVTAGDILAGKVAVNQNGDVTGNIQTYSGSKTIYPSGSVQTLETGGKFVDGNITVNAVATEEKTPTIDFDGVTEVEVTPSTGKLLTKVTIERPDDLVAANIKRGKTVFGIEGNLEEDKPDQYKTVTPTSQAQVVEPDTGYELASVTVNAVPVEQKTVKSTTSSQTITPTQGKFIDEITVSPIVLQEKSVTPTTSSQEITPDTGNDGLSKVTVGAIQTTNVYVHSSTEQETYTPQAGTYIDEVIITPVTVQEKTVEPNQSGQVVTPDTNYEWLSQVTVGAAPLQDMIIAPITTEQTIVPDEGYYGIGSITISAVDPDEYTDPYDDELAGLNSGSGIKAGYEENESGTTMNILSTYTTEENETGTTVLF